MRKMIKIKRKGIAGLIVVVLILTILVSVCKIQPEAEAQSTSISTIKVTYLAGDNGTITVAEGSNAEVTYTEKISATETTRNSMEQSNLEVTESDNEKIKEDDEEKEQKEIIETVENTTNESNENNILSEEANEQNEAIIASKIDDESSAINEEVVTRDVTGVTLVHEVKAQQTCGSYDYTDGKIVLMVNGENGITFDGGKTTYNNLEYDRVLTGYKLVSVTKSDGTVITDFVEPENQNYADKTNASKDIGTIYSQNGWYIVPDDVVEIEVEAVYGRAIYIRSPYDKMYYDDYHIFYYGTNNDGTSSKEGTAIEKSSDDNNGTSPDDAIATLKRAYELIESDISQTVYDNVVVLCGDFYEVNYHSDGQSHANKLGTAGTYKNYCETAFGYNTDAGKPITITSNQGEKYNCILSASSYDFRNYSDLRLDNVNVSNLRESDMELRWGLSKSTYPKYRQFTFYTNDAYFETTENLVANQSDNIEIRFKNSKSFRLNGGRWNVVQSYSNETNTLTKGKYVYVGGLSYYQYITNAGRNNGNNKETKLTNPYTIVVTGGYIETGLYGSGQAQLRLCCRKCEYIYIWRKN